MNHVRLVLGALAHAIQCAFSDTKLAGRESTRSASGGDYSVSQNYDGEENEWEGSSALLSARGGIFRQLNSDAATPFTSMSRNAPCIPIFKHSHPKKRDRIATASGFVTVDHPWLQENKLEDWSNGISDVDGN